MKKDKFQENLSRPGIIDAKARRLRNTRLDDTQTSTATTARSEGRVQFTLTSVRTNFF